MTSPNENNQPEREEWVTELEKVFPMPPEWEKTLEEPVYDLDKRYIAVESFIRTQKSKSYKEGKENVTREILKDVVKIILDSKATFFVKRPYAEIPTEEALYELKAEICTNIENYFLSRLRQGGDEKKQYD